MRRLSLASAAWLVLKKDWQRMPTQLLLEWTQREQRPRPQYHRARPNRGKGGKGAGECAEESAKISSWRGSEKGGGCGAGSV